MLAFILTDSYPDALRFIRAVSDFTIFTEYRSYNEEIFQYIQSYIARIDQLKKVFRSIRPIDPITKEAYFNFLKFHIIVYYPDFVRLYDCPDSTDLEIPEIAYRYIVK